MSELRFALVHQVLSVGGGVSSVAREFGVSRKTAYKWLARHGAAPLTPLADRSRRPLHSPRRTLDSIEQQVLEVRRRHHWGPRKIHRVLLDQQVAVPSLRTVASILSRHGCIGAGGAGEARVADSPQLFERQRPNELWQLDHKGPLEVARQRVTPLAVLDDYSRYCLRFEAVTDRTMQTTWNVLWELMGEVGMPESILCDNAFSAPVGLSWFDARLVRLDIQPLHGRPYHPQTQGKVERLNGTAQRELIDFDARRDCLEHFSQDSTRWRMTYNTIRPHEALGDLPPAARWKPSPRVRPDALPQVTYPAGSVTRRVSYAGDFRYRNARILVGRSLTGQTLRIEERAEEIGVYYGWKQVRVIPQSNLGGPRSHQMV